MQVIVDGVGKPLGKLLMTIAAVRAMEIPEGCFMSVHVIHDARSAACQLGRLLGIALDSGFPRHDSMMPADTISLSFEQ